MNEDLTPHEDGRAVAPECAPQTSPVGEAPGSTATPVDERIARAFHTAYETLAPSYDYKTRDASAVEWPDVPANNRELMCAVVNALLDARVISPAEPADDALTYCRLALTALDLGNAVECTTILTRLIGRLIDAGARDALEDAS